MDLSIKDIKNFSSLISNLGVEIPLIQRDYVQGRIHDTAELAKRNDDEAKALLKKYTDEKEKRDKFVAKLISALLSPIDKSMRLAFLYGTKETSSATINHHSDSFIPLDGQQRLTTLFLLSWALIFKMSPDDRKSIENTDSFKSFNKGLHSLGYKTRPSSRDFCASLFGEKTVPIANCNSIQELVSKQTWFRDDWSMDPTVCAMLQMLDQMVADLSHYTESQCKLMFDNLLDINGDAIGFELLDMHDYQLTDGLYIKMNARGKQLTKFENWKSEFIGFLETHHRGVLYEKASQEICDTVFGGNKPSLKEYFEYSIEHSWTDLFWTYCKSEIKEHDSLVQSNPNLNKREKDCYPVIDDYFMNFFYAAHQLLFFIEHKTEESRLFQDTMAQREETFKKGKNVENLFDWLDILKSFNDNDIYSQLFFTESGNQYSHPDKIRLFDGNQINLLTRCSRGANFTNIVQIILYGMLRYAQEFGCPPIVTNEFKVYVRQIRNMLEGVCSVRNKDVNVVNTLQIIDIYGFSGKIEQLIKDIKVARENETSEISSYWLIISPEQAEIEDFDFVFGNLAPKLLPNNQSSSPSVSLAVLRDVLKAWDALDEYSKISLLIAYSYEGKSMMPCAHGFTYLFGNNDRWKPIFMKDEGVEKAIIAISSDYKNMIDNGMPAKDVLPELLKQKRCEYHSSGDFGFAYYVLHYKPFIYAHAKGKDSCMYFSINGDRNALDLCAVIYSNKPTLPYHTDPIIFATKEELYKGNTQKTKLFLAYSVQGAERACLQIFDTQVWDGNPPIGSICHLSGLHGAGGWKYIDSQGQESIFKDDVSKDRIIAGVEILRSLFPDNDFAEKG